MNRVLSSFLAVLLLVLLLGANLYVLRDLQDIASPPFEPAESQSPPFETSAEVVRIGVISRFAPNIIFSGYQPIMDYLNQNSDRTYELRLSTSYQDAVDQLRSGEVAASFLGAWIYSHLANNEDLIPLAAPRNKDGQSEFRAILVTGPDSRITQLFNLKGARVALPSGQSWSGNWLQVSGLASVGLSVADLDSLHHFDHHQTVVWQVLRGHFDAGVVKASVARRYVREGLRPVLPSPPIPGPPLVGFRNGDPEILDDIRSLLLALDPNVPGDKVVLESWTPEFSFGFIPVDEATYMEAFGQLEAGP